MKGGSSLDSSDSTEIPAKKKIKRKLAKKKKEWKLKSIDNRFNNKDTEVIHKN